MSPVPSVARLLRDARLRRGMTLEQVHRALLGDGTRLPVSTLSKIERGHLDPGVDRMHALLRVYDIDPRVIGELVDEERARKVLESDQNIENLRDRAVEAMQAGRMREAYALVFAAKNMTEDDRVPKEQRHLVLLTLAHVASQMGKLSIAWDLVERILSDDPDPTMTIQSLVQGAGVLLNRSAPQAAMAFVERALKLRPTKRLRAVTLHQLARARFRCGEHERALEDLKRAEAQYRRIGDRFLAAKAILTAARMYEGRDLERAIEAARSAIRLSKSKQFRALQTSGQLLLGYLLCRRGDAAAGLRILNSGRANAIVAENPELEFLAHYHAWRAHRTLGNEERAEIELRGAAFLARQISDRGDEVLEVLTAIRRLDA